MTPENTSTPTPKRALPANILSKEEFIDLFTSLQRWDKVLSEMSDVVGKLLTPHFEEDKFAPAPVHLVDPAIPEFYKDLILKTIHRMFNLEDDPEGSIIDYFVYDLNYGADYAPGDVVDPNGVDIPLATPLDLYAYLVNTFYEEEYGYANENAETLAETQNEKNEETKENVAADEDDAQMTLDDFGPGVSFERDTEENNEKENN